METSEKWDDDDDRTIMTDNLSVDIEADLKDKLTGTLVDELFPGLEVALPYGSYFKSIGKVVVRGLLKGF